MSAPLSRRVLAATLLRTLLIQGSWNYRSMIGNGIAFALIPGLRELHRAEGGEDGQDRGEVAHAVERHLEHFNAHPYLANMAVGSLLRLEADGEAPETMRRFKTAVRGPLGGLGDTLVWATWLPIVAMIALALYWLGLGGATAALFFVALYNVGHLGLRLWGFRAGWLGGRALGADLARVGLGQWAQRLRRAGVVVLGVLAGALLGGDEGLGGAGPEWIALGVAGFLLGLNMGHHVWRPAAVAVVGAITVLAVWGVLS